MPDSLIGELRVLASGPVPPGWAACDGQLLLIDENPFLFDAIGTRFGGDGATTFAVPDLRGRSPLGAGPLHPLGTRGGQESVVLTVAELAAHRHVLQGSAADGTAAGAAGRRWAASDARPYAAAAGEGHLHESALAPAGAGEAHENMMPFLGLLFVISLEGQLPRDGIAADVALGEVRIFAFDFEPPGWLRCDGRAIDVGARPELAPLSALLGARFGTGAALPDLRDRFPIHEGAGLALGATGGVDAHALSPAELPPHRHAARAAEVPGDTRAPQGRIWGAQPAALAYGDGPTVAMAADAIEATGGATHDNMPPFLALAFCIAFEGLPLDENQAAETWSGEIRMFTFATPAYWAACDGGGAPDVQFPLLAPRLAPVYGRPAPGSFSLPDLRGRVPLGAGAGAGLTARALGAAGGAAEVALTERHLPVHTHLVRAGGAGGLTSPAGAHFGAPEARALSTGYATGPGSAVMAEEAVLPAGEGRAHENRAPYVVLNFCLSLEGS